MAANSRYKFRPKPGSLTTHLDGIVIDLWNAGGMSYAQLAKKMEEDGHPLLTRSQIGGKLNRAEARGVYVRRPGAPDNILNPGIGPYAGKRRPKERVRTKKQPAPEVVVSVVAAPPVPKPKPKAVAPAPEDYHGPFSLEEVQKKNGCRFPTGDRPNVQFCGRERKDDSAYCQNHHARCHSAMFVVPDDRRMPRSML